MAKYQNKGKTKSWRKGASNSFSFTTPDGQIKKISNRRLKQLSVASQKLRAISSVLLENLFKRANIFLKPIDVVNPSQNNEEVINEIK